MRISRISANHLIYDIVASVDSSTSLISNSFDICVVKNVAGVQVGYKPNTSQSFKKQIKLTVFSDAPATYSDVGAYRRVLNR